MTSRHRRSFALAWIVLLCAIGCQQKPIPSHQMISGRTMGTSYTLTLVPWTGMPALKEIAQQINVELESVNQQMSTYMDTSELSRFNASDSLEWFEVSSQTAEVVKLALEVNKLTDGAFDVTVGPLVDLWGFGPPGRPKTAPSDESIAEILQSIGSEKLQVRLDPPALKKSVAALRVDLSAIAKGHGVDRVAGVFESIGCENYFVEIGGEVRTRGSRIDGAAWRVGIEKPVENEREIPWVAAISDQSLATSGDYRNFYDSAGHRLSHFIDPKSGRPIEGNMASASVVADNCALADALATGLMASGFEKAQQLAQANGWTVMLIARRDAEFLIQTSPAFEALLTEPSTTTE